MSIKPFYLEDSAEGKTVEEQVEILKTDGKYITVKEQNITDSENPFACVGGTIDNPEIQHHVPQSLFNTLRYISDKLRIQHES